jgi:hypothetical protein
MLSAFGDNPGTSYIEARKCVEVGMSPKFLASVLLKAQIVQFLGVDASLSKVSLIEQLADLLENNEHEYQRLLATFPCELAVEPVELCQLLGCSGSERRRWFKEGKLPILEYRSFRAAGRELSYPVRQ